MWALNPEVETPTITTHFKDPAEVHAPLVGERNFLAAFEVADAPLQQWDLFTPYPHLTPDSDLSRQYSPDLGRNSSLRRTTGLFLNARK